MYQLISHSLGIKDDKTKWTLVFSNVTEDDICESLPRAIKTELISPVRRKEWDNLAKANHDRLEVKYVVDKASKNWKGLSPLLETTSTLYSLSVPGETDCITAPMISKLFFRKEGGGDKVMAFVCGPPPQVKSIAGPKDGPRQGELLGALMDLRYASEEVFKF